METFMKSHNLSVSQSAVRSADVSEDRLNIYAGIHKAIRKYLCDTLTRLGSVDGDDARELEEGLAQLRTLLAFCASHLRHENTFVHPAMEAHRPGSSAEIGEEHVHHDVMLAQLDDLAAAAEQAAAGAPRARALTRLYRQFALFVAENLTHMHVEETEHNAVLWATHSDTELMAIEQAIVASIPPQEAAEGMRWMIPAMNAEERLAMLSGMRMQAPPPVFDGVLGIARSHLPDLQWRKLADGLALSEKLAA
jgi:iron-sulfur cluster repair protein YtfE (RIC family)